MPQKKILIDTNAYLRLAQTIRPLLGKSFGKEKFTLYIHKRFEEEINKSQRLKSKFYWVNNVEYVGNRKKRLVLSKQNLKEIESAFEYIRVFQNEHFLGLSRVDIYCISTALSLNIPLVTDDQNMIKVCKEFELEVLSTLELLKLMYDNGHIDFDLVKQIIEYWKYEEDLPTNIIKLNKDFKKLFE